MRSVILILVLATGLLTGCTTPAGGPNYTGSGALIGAASGAGIGALATRGHPAGALIGAAAGALTGGLIGQSMDQQVYGPPPPVAVVPPPPPRYGWVAGQWVWNGYTWAWMPGHWVMVR